MNITIALPCYDFKVYSWTMISIFNCIDHLRKDGHKVTEIICNNGNAYVSDARNNLVDRFLKGRDDVMIFVDSDLAFDGDAMNALVITNKQIVGGVYTFKSEKEGFPLHILTDDNDVLIKDGNYFECDYLPTGLLKIHRDVFERYRKAYPDQKAVHYFTYFENILDKKTGLWEGEDIYFCRRCREMGERIWLYPNINFKHIGMKEYEGNYYEYLKANAKRV